MSDRNNFVFLVGTTLGDPRGSVFLVESVFVGV